jgi:hypothetical protein
MQLAAIVEADYVTVPADDSAIGDISNEEQLLQAIVQLEAQMREAAKNFEFERAAVVARQDTRALKQRDLGVISTTGAGLPVELRRSAGGLPPRRAAQPRKKQGCARVRLPRDLGASGR